MCNLYAGKYYYGYGQFSGPKIFCNFSNISTSFAHQNEDLKETV